MKTIINDELIMGEPLKIESTLKIEIANQILKMGASDYEDVCNNMRLLADVFEIIEEHIDKDIVRLVYNPMGSWQDESRYCDECHNYMDEGYCIENGLNYYCCDECLHKHYTDEEFNKLYDNGNGDSYWTEW